MKITIACRSQLYDRIVQPLQDVPNIECSPALHQWGQFREWIKNGTDAIILDEGVPFSDPILSMAFPRFNFDGSREYPDRVMKWIDSLGVRLTKAEKVVEEVPEEQTNEEPDDFFFVAQPPADDSEADGEEQPPIEAHETQEKEELQIPFIPRKQKRQRYFSQVYTEPQEQVEETINHSNDSAASVIEPTAPIIESPPPVYPTREEPNQPKIEQPEKEDHFYQVPAQKQNGEPNNVSWNELTPVIPAWEPPTSSVVLSPETITVFSGKGGVGVDTISLHLAGIYAKAGIKVSVVDLALPFGHISTYLNVAPSSYAGEIIQDRGEFYVAESELKRMTVEHRNIHYYLPPNQWPSGFRYEEGKLDKIIRNMQRLAPITICNLNPYHDWSAQLMAFSLSTRIYWVLDMNKATIFHTKRHLVTLRELGFAGQGKIQFILNRVVNQDIDIRMIEETLGGKVIQQLPEDETLATAMNNHTILTQTSKQTPFTSKLHSMVGITKGSTSGKLSKLLKGR